MNSTTATIKTRAAAGGTAVVTNATFNWEGMTPEDVQALAQAALVVKLQAGWRKGTIPEGDITVNAAEFKVGTRAPKAPADIKTIVAKLSPEQRAALIAQLQAM